MFGWAVVAVQWVAGLLDKLDVSWQGIGLLGRDALLLGAHDQPLTIFLLLEDGRVGH